LHGVPFCLIVDAAATVTLNVENSEHVWLPAEEAVERLMWATDRALLAEAMEVVVGNGPAKTYMRIDF
jgi:hypothetical protein